MNEPRFLLTEHMDAQTSHHVEGSEIKQNQLPQVTHTRLHGDLGESQGSPVSVCTHTHTHTHTCNAS